MPRKRSKKNKKLKPVENIFDLFGGDDDDFAGIFEGMSDEELQQALAEKKQGISSDKVRPLKDRLRTYPGVEAELDLHGLIAEEAERRIEFFIKSSRDKGLRTVRVITGKGLHSPHGRAVLPDVADLVIRRLRNEKIVLAARWKGKNIAESGSVIVYLES